MRKTILGLVLWALASLFTGCFAVNDQGPVLSVELFWDGATGSKDFTGTTCDKAGVDSMTWTLYAVDGTHKVKSTGNTEVCADAIDIFALKPGEYTLEISGTDANGNRLWPKDECTKLWVSRFDISYDCSIAAP